MLLLILHWFSCLWYVIISMNNAWFPPKDGSLASTNFYIGSLLIQYADMFYYQMLLMVGNDVMPTN